MIIEFDRLYPELVCDDAPVINDYWDDPWDGEKPCAEGLMAIVPHVLIRVRREAMNDFERIERMERARGIIRGVTAELNDHGLSSAAIALSEVDTFILSEAKELKLEAFGGGLDDAPAEETAEADD